MMGLGCWDGISVDRSTDTCVDVLMKLSDAAIMSSRHATSHRALQWGGRIAW